jgi:hypothetical protein
MTEETNQPGEAALEATPPTSGQEPKTYDAEYVGKLRKESADYRTKLRDAEKQLERLAELEEAERKRQEASLSETERLTQALAAKDAEIAEAKAASEKATEAARQALIKAEARALATNFIDFDDVWKLADLSGAAVDGDKVTGVKEALEALAKAKPHLLKDGKQPPGSPPKKPREGDGHRPPPPDTKPARPVISF